MKSIYFRSPGENKPRILNRNRLLDNNRLLNNPGLLNRNILLDKNRTRQAQTTKHARMMMKLIDLDALVTFIKVWVSESAG